MEPGVPAHTTLSIYELLLLTVWVTGSNSRSLGALISYLQNKEPELGKV